MRIILKHKGVDVPFIESAHRRGDLLISDAETTQTYRWSSGLGDGLAMSEHAGLLHLPDGDAAFVDEIAGQVVGLRGGRIAWTAPCAIPSEHLATDPRGRYLVVTSGLGHNEAVWASVVTVIDRGDADERAHGRQPRVRRFRTRIGEPGVIVIGGKRPHIVLRHREPGALELIDIADAMSVRCGVPQLTGRIVSGLPDTAHGDLLIPSETTAEVARMLIASDRGVEEWRVDTSDEPTAALAHIHPWCVGGRGWFLYWAHELGVALAVVRQGGVDPRVWDTWTNALWIFNPRTGEVATHDIGDGLVFRLAPVAGGVALSRVHPDGDEVVVIDVATGSGAGLNGPSAAAAPQTPLRASLRRRIPLPAMPNGPKRGGSPWEGCTRRAIAADPRGVLVAVSSGGEGLVHLVDVGEGRVVDDLCVNAPLNEGSMLAWVDGRRGPGLDTVGR